MSNDREALAAAYTYEARINRAWSARPGKVDWLGMESTLRMVLRDYRAETIDAQEALMRVDSTIAAFTRRGTELEG